MEIQLLNKDYSPKIYKNHLRPYITQNLKHLKLFAKPQKIFLHNYFNPFISVSFNILLPIFFGIRVHPIILSHNLALFDSKLLHIFYQPPQ